MLHANGVKLTEITDELKRRKNISGIEEKKISWHLMIFYS
jgi:phosphoribosyl-ATP pyrophosphohydrolase